MTVQQTVFYRYANRKLYSKKKKAYVNLDEVLTAVREAPTTTIVLDFVTKTDITAATVTAAVAVSEVGQSKILEAVKAGTL